MISQNTIKEKSSTSSIIKKGSDKYVQYGLGSWIKNPIKRGCIIQYYQTDKIYALKCEFILDHSLSETILFFEDGGEESIQPQLVDSETIVKIEENMRVVTKKSKLFYKTKQQSLTEDNLVYQMRDQKNYYVVSEHTQLENKAKQCGSIQVKKELDVIHVKSIDDNKEKTSLTILKVFQKDKNFKISKKLIKTQIYNTASINKELKAFNQSGRQFLQIVGNPSKMEKRDNTIEQKDSNSSNNSTKLEEEKSEIQYSDDIKYLNQNDRDDILQVVDPEHPAWKYADMHDRSLLLNEQQKAQLADLKQRTKKYRVKQNFLVRNLIARNFDVQEAEWLLEDCIRWRRANDVNSRKMSDYPLFQEERLHQIIGQDKWGHPILYNDCGNSHPEKFGQGEFTIENYLKFNQAFIEEALNMMKGNVDSYLVIIDCYNATRKNIPPAVIKESFKQFFQYYAARPYKTMIVNANFLVSSIFALIKPILPKRTLERLAFIGQNQAQIRETFLKEMDIDVLPVRFGGNNPLVR